MIDKKELIKQVKRGLYTFTITLTYVIGFYAAIMYVMSFGTKPALIGAAILFALGIAFAHNLSYMYYKAVTKIISLNKKAEVTDDVTHE